MKKEKDQKLWLEDKYFSQYELIILTSDPYIINDYIDYNRIGCIGITVTPENLIRVRTALSELFEINGLSINEFSGTLEVLSFKDLKVLINDHVCIKDQREFGPYDMYTCFRFKSKTGTFILESTTTLSGDVDNRINWSLHMILNWIPKSVDTGHWGSYGMGVHRLLGQGIPITNPIKNMKFLKEICGVN